MVFLLLGGRDQMRVVEVMHSHHKWDGQCINKFLDLLGGAVLETEMQMHQIDAP